MELVMATLATNVSFQCLGLDGKPLAGGKVYTYEAGTTTPKSTYTTMAGDVPNPNPVILDQNGKAKIFLGDGAYRMRILDSNDALIDDIDQISRYVTQSEFATFQQTVQDGVDQLTEVREQIDVFVNSAVGNQKGYANGIAPLDVNVKIDPVYLPAATLLEIGVVQLNNTLTSTSTTQAATAAQVKVLNDQAFGIGQTLQNVTASRAVNTVYTNSTDKPITVILSFTASQLNSSGVFTLNGYDIAWYEAGSSIGQKNCLEITVGIGETYKSNVMPSQWLERR